MQSSSGSSDTTLAAWERSTADIHARAPSGSSASTGPTECLKPPAGGLEFVCQDILGRMIGLAASPNDNIHGRKYPEEMHADDGAQLPLQPVSHDAVLSVLRHDNPHSRMTKKGSYNPELEVFSPDPLPFTCHPTEIRAPYQPLVTRKAKAIRRQRTWTAVEPSAAVAPSCDVGSAPHAPSGRPSEHESRACVCGVCCSDGMWASP